MASPLLKHLSRLTPTAFPAGATLIAEGAAAVPLCVLATGTLEVLRAGEVVVTLAEPGAEGAATPALLGRPASATVRAKTAATAYIVDDPERFFERSPAVLLEIARGLAHRLDTTTDFLVQSRHRFAGQEDMAFLEDVFALLGAEPTTPVTGTKL